MHSARDVTIMFICSQSVSKQFGMAHQTARNASTASAVDSSHRDGGATTPHQANKVSMIELLAPCIMVHMVKSSKVYVGGQFKP